MSKAGNVKFYIFTLSFCILIFTFFITKNVAVAPIHNQYSKLPLVQDNKISTTTLVVVGDIMLSRNVGAKIDKAGNPNLPFEKLQPILANADVTFGNLECPLSDSNVPIREGLIFRCLTKHASGLEYAGFDALSTANNHSFDQGLDNLEFTIDYLKSHGILPVGTTNCHCEECNDEAISSSSSRDCFPLDSALGRNDNIVERNGIKFGFLAYSYSAHNDGKSTADPQVATMDISQLQSDIAALKTEADVIIVSMHAGTEYTRKPTQKQIDFAHAAIDAGADIIIGHHPHWIQTIEIYPPVSPPAPPSSPNSPPLRGGDKGEGEIHRGLILYSLGNFVFDQMWSQETREGLMVKFNFLGKALKSAELIPVIIDNYCCPRLADEKEKTEILKKISEISDMINFQK